MPRRRASESEDAPIAVDSQATSMTDARPVVHRLGGCDAGDVQAPVAGT